MPQAEPLVRQELGDGLVGPQLDLDVALDQPRLVPFVAVQLESNRRQHPLGVELVEPVRPRATRQRTLTSRATRSGTVAKAEPSRAAHVIISVVQQR